LTIKSLDGLRGLAVLLVLLSHMSLAGIDLMPGLDFSGAGKSGVYLFFVLSAFLLTWQALGDNNLSSGRYWTGYAIRRVCRIYPLYTIILVYAFAISQWAQGYTPTINSLMDLFRHLSLQDGNGIYWAIPVEFKYYLLLPFVTFTLYIASKVHLTAPLTIAALAISSIHLLWPAAEISANSIKLGPYLGMFFLGSLTALFCFGKTRDTLSRYSWALQAIGTISVLAALATIPSVARFLFNAEMENNSFHREFLFYGIAWSGAVLAAFYGGSFYTKLFELKACRFVGRVSFSVYLWHFTIIQLVKHHVDFHPSIQFWVVIFMTVIVSYLSYRFLERPCIAWGHSMSERLMKP